MGRKNFLKSFICLLFAISLTGCTNFMKYNSLKEYNESIHSDIIYYEQIEISSKQMISCSNVKEQAAYIGILEENFKDLKENAEGRNSSIKDPDIKEIDDSYVNMIKDMYNSFKVMHEGINEYDQKKFNAGLNNMSVALDSFSECIDKLEQYADKYDINTEDFNELKQEIGKMQEVY